jgi:hypothetical protein
MARPPRTRFAAPFVVVVTAAGGCGDGKKSGGTTPPDPDTKPKVQSTWHVRKTPTGECMATQSVDCPKDRSCNPPAPMGMPCPPEKANDEWFTVVSFDGKSCVLDGTQTAVTCPSYDYHEPPPAPAIDAAVAVAAQMRRWKIERIAKDCFAAPDPDPCEQLHLKPGDPIPPCNPPEPIKLTSCPPAHVVAIVESAPGTCEMHSNADCDPGVKCNPPPPTATPCPHY